MREMPVAQPQQQHRESAPSTVSRYLLPKPPRHSPQLLPGPGSHHGFSPDPQACLQVSRPLLSAGAAGTRRLTCRYLSGANRFPRDAIAARPPGLRSWLGASSPGRHRTSRPVRSPAGGTPRSAACVYFFHAPLLPADTKPGKLAGRARWTAASGDARTDAAETRGGCPPL